MARKNPKYYDIANPPLLIQGFATQTTNDLIPILEDRQDFVTEVNRGVVNFIDFQTQSNRQIANPILEGEYNGTLITILAAGKEILRDNPAERFNYVFDIGGIREQKIPVIINGGQTLTSKFFLPAASDNIPANQFYLGQLLAHYTTEAHQTWLKDHRHFNSGLGLKRQSFRHVSPIGAPASGTTLEGVVPKNQGNVIGFSILHLGIENMQQFIEFSIDGLRVIKNVNSARFSKLNQRDPFIHWIPLNPGSTFELKTAQRTPAASLAQTISYITFYFSN